jgi:hypothetical protein
MFGRKEIMSKNIPSLPLNDYFKKLYILWVYNVISNNQRRNFELLIASLTEWMLLTAFTWLPIVVADLSHC